MNKSHPTYKIDNICFCKTSIDLNRAHSRCNGCGGAIFWDKEYNLWFHCFGIQLYCLSETKAAPQQNLII